ncbi:TPA: hypothetical protein ACVO12_004748 [Vibrio diabolicus]
MILNEDTLKKATLALSIFFLSLENHDNSRLIIVLAILFIYFIIHPKSYLNKNILKVLFAISFLIMTISIFSHYEWLSYVSNMNNYGSIDFFGIMIFKLILIAICFYVSGLESKVLADSLKVVIAIHVSVFFFQLIVVYSTSYYIDLLQPFTGEASRYTWGVRLPIIGNTYRPTGFYNEPSTYSAFVICLFILRYHITNKIDKLDKALLSSLFLSLSFASIFCAFFLMYFIKNNKENYKLKFLLATTVVVTLIPFVIDLLVLRTSGNYDAIGMRLGLFDVIFNQSMLDIFFGSGPVGVPREIEYLVNNPGASWARQGLPALNDNGLGTFILMKFGVIGLILLLGILKFNLKSNRHFLCSLVILITKLKYTSFIFLIYIFYVFIRKNMKHSHSV